MSDVAPPMNQVLLDFENVHQVDLSVFGSRPVSLTLLLGAQQTKIETSLLEGVMQQAACVQIVRLESSGRNALDFALAYYLGRVALTDPTAHFHIISKDKGFDSLITHLRSRHIKAHRHDGFSQIALPAAPKPPLVSEQKLAAPTKTAPTKTPVAKTSKPAEKPVTRKESAVDLELLERIVAYLRRKTKNRPKTRKSLASDLCAHFPQEIAIAEVDPIIASLAEKKHISLTQKGAVSYLLE
jgi:hypothetical protein